MNPPAAWAEELIAHLLASRNARNRDAYTHDLRDSAHLVGQEPAGAVVRLLVVAQQR